MSHAGFMGSIGQRAGIDGWSRFLPWVAFNRVGKVMEGLDHTTLDLADRRGLEGLVVRLGFIGVDSPIRATYTRTLAHQEVIDRPSSCCMMSARNWSGSC